MWPFNGDKALKGYRFMLISLVLIFGKTDVIKGTSHEFHEFYKPFITIFWNQTMDSNDLTDLKVHTLAFD